MPSLPMRQIHDTFPLFPLHTHTYSGETQWQSYCSRLHELMDAAEKGSRAKSTFLAVASHELRTPLK